MGALDPIFAELLGLEEKRLVVGRVEGFELAVLPRRARKAAREADQRSSYSGRPQAYAGPATARATGISAA